MKARQAYLTPDIKQEWGPVHKAISNIVRRLQSEAKTEGCAIVTMRIAVNSDGNPICWSQPFVTRLEPKSSCSVDELLETLTN